MQKIFLAFPGFQVSFKQKIKRIGDFEFWNLEKISEDEFISLVQKKIRPFNKNVKKNYFTVSTEQDFRESYKNSSWGMLLPNYTKDRMDGRYESLFTTNLFTGLNLPVMFFVQQMGVLVERKKIEMFEKAKFHSEDKKFSNKKFIEFYKAIFPALIGVRWQAYEVAAWSRENWRVHISCLLFEGLAKYQRSKQVMTWQAECAEIVSFYEALLSKEANDNGQYRISQRIEVLLGKYYRKEMPQILNGLKELYSSRNDFVHGSFFDRLKKTTRTYPNDQGMAQLPTVDFNFLETQSRIAKQVFIVFVYLKKKLKSKRGHNQKTIPEMVDAGVMDVRARKRIQGDSNEILKLTSYRPA